MSENYSDLPKTRAEARRIGSTRYFTGEMCSHGHIEPRKTCNGNCIICSREIRSRYSKTDRGRERQSLHSANYRSTDNGRGVRKSLKAERRAAEKQATPPWYDRKQAQAFYRACPKGYHVDHIVPLIHDDVCGLHVLENFQHLPAHENIKKSNSLIPITLEACVCPISIPGKID